MRPEYDWPRGTENDIVPGVWIKKLVIWPRMTIDKKLLLPFSTGFRRSIYIEGAIHYEWITEKEYVYLVLKGKG